MFDWKQGNALHTMQGNRDSSRSKGEVSWFFSSCRGNLGYILELQLGLSFKATVCSVTSGFLFSYEGHLRNLLDAWEGNRDAYRGEA